MPESQRFPFLQDIGERFLPAPMPYLKFTLKRQELSREVYGLLDTGSTVSVKRSKFIN